MTARERMFAGNEKEEEAPKELAEEEEEDEDAPCQLHCWDCPCGPFTGPVVAVSAKGAGVNVEKTY